MDCRDTRHVNLLNVAEPAPDDELLVDKVLWKMMQIPRPVHCVDQDVDGGRA